MVSYLDKNKCIVLFKYLYMYQAKSLCYSDSEMQKSPLLLCSHLILAGHSGGRETLPLTGHPDIMYNYEHFTLCDCPCMMPRLACRYVCVGV